METRVVKLLSNGLIAGVPKEVTIRSMNGSIEKYIFSAKSDESFLVGLGKAIIEPKLDLEVLRKIPQEDLLYLLFNLRAITYGDEVSQSYVCPDCLMRSTIKYSIDDIPVNYLSEDVFSSFTLPVSKIVVVPKLPQASSIRIALNQMKRDNVPAEDEYLLAYASIVDTYNGEKLPIEVLMAKLDDLHSKDLVPFRDYLLSLKGSFGLAETVTVECPHCLSEGEMKIAISDNFFR